LGVEFVDLYQLHGYVPDCPLEETVSAMGDLMRQGKVLYWGLSNFNAVWTMMALDACDRMGVERPVSHQPEYNLIESGLVDTEGKYRGLDELSEKYGFGIIPYSPLAGGVLTGKYLDGIPEKSRMKDDIWTGWKKTALSERNLAFVRALKPTAEKLGVTLTQLSLAWILSRPFVDAAVTAWRNTDQLEESLGAAEVTLDAETLETIDALRKRLKSGELG
jgi:aryl-alcohol dehydrogenase-like predicted oxidoreductase